MQDSKFANIYFSEFCSFLFKVPVEKVAIDQEELHGIDVGELTRNIAKKKKPDVLQAYRCPLRDMCYSSIFCGHGSTRVLNLSSRLR